jgi:DNA-binding transcriptional LysR family regulator
MDIELRHLRVICAIAETGSVTKAATALGLPQPALTTQLQRIERALGGRLFERDRRGARPTALGELVLARACVLIPAVRSLQDDAAQLVGTGEVMVRYRIGATNGPVTGGLIHRLSTAHPDKRVSTHATWSADELAGAVRDGRLDFALVGACAESTPAPAYGLTWRAVCVDPVWVLMRERHPLAGRAEVALADLADEQWASAPGDGCFIECFVAACARAGFTPRHIYEMDVAGCVDLITSGAGVVLCQATFRGLPGIAMVPIAGTPLQWRHLVGWNPDSVASGAAGEVLALAGAAYRDVIGQRPAYAAWLADHPGFGTHTGR